MLNARGLEVNSARRKEIHLQKLARNAAKSSRLGRSSSLLLWVLALSEAPEALGRVDPGRSDPDYALARYLQPCKSVSECGARQFCTSGRCACPFNLGLVGGPQCTTTSKAAWLLISWVLFLGVLELGLAYLHILNLKAHWTPYTVENGSPASPSRVHPLSLPHASAEGGLSQSEASPARRPLCEVLLTFKSLFSLSSLVFCLAQLVFCVTTPRMILDHSSDLGVLYTAPNSVETVAVLLSFNGLAFAYLFVGEIWLDAASRFRLRIFIGTRLSKLLIQLPAAVLCVLTVFYVLTSNSPSAQMLVAMLGLGVCALIASGFLTMGASIMVPVISARAKQAQEARKLVTASIASAGEGNGMYAVQDGPKEHKSILRWLRRKREEPFRPFLSQIMEVDSTALEDSASHGYLNTTGKLSDPPQTPRTPGGPVGPTDNPWTGLARPGLMHVQRAGVAQGEEEEGGVKPLFQATVTRSFDGLAWHVASTAIQVGCASGLSMVAYLVAIVLFDDPQHHHFSPWRGVLGTMFAYAAFPLCHLYANAVCLSVISREAREATRPLRRSLSRVATAASNLVCSVVCCGLSEDGMFEGSSGVSRGDEPDLS